MPLALSVVCAALTLAFLLGRRDRVAGRPVGFVALILAAVAAPLMIALALTGSAGQLGAPRLAVTQAAKDGAALDAGETLSLGSDPAHDDLVLSGLTSQLIQIRRSADAASALVQTAPGASAAVVSVDHGASPLVGARPFDPGDRVCVAKCAAPDARWYELAPGGDGLSIVGAVNDPLPKFTRRAIIDTSFAHLGERVMDWGFDERIYPLRTFGFELAKAPERADACPTRYVCEDDAATPAKSFLFHSGGLDLYGVLGGGKLWIMLLDPGAQLKSGTVTASAAPAAIPLGAGETHVNLYAVHYDDPDWTNHPEVLADLSRLSTPKSLFLSVGPTGAVARIDTPGVREIERDDLTVAASLGGSAQLDLYGGAAGAGAGGDPLVLSQLGGALAGNLRSHLRFDGADDFGRADHHFEFASNGQTATRSFGDTVEVVTAAPRGGQASVDLHIDALQLPWLMLLLPTAWAALGLWANGPRWRTDGVAWMIESAAQLLLALRWLVALEGGFLDPDVDAADLLAAGACAYTAAPMLLAALAPRPSGANRRWPVLVPFAACSVAAAWIAYGRPDPVSLGFWAIAAGALVFSEERPPLAWLTSTGKAAAHWTGRVAFFFLDLPFLPARLIAKTRGRSAPARASTRWLTAAVALRLVLLLFGVKERISFPAHLAVTTIYLPMLLIGFALLLTEPRREGEPGWARPLRYWLWLPITYLAVPSLARDHGFFLTLTLPAALYAAFALRPPSQAQPKTPLLARIMWPAPAAVLGIGLVAVLLVGPLLNAGLQSQMAAAVASHDAAKAEATLGKIAQNDDNSLRLYMIAYPQGLEAAGTLGAEQVSVLSEQLAQYTGDLFGHGYLTRSKMADEIRPVQMTDNLSAVHMMSPFGRLGAALFVVMLGALALNCGVLSQPGPHPERRAVGLLALWSFFGAGAYIILANLQLTPFTGRNVYLLAANSHSDLIEGLTLLALAQVGLAEKRL